MNDATKRIAVQKIKMLMQYEKKDVRRMKSSELLALPGIGHETLKAIREFTKDGNCLLAGSCQYFGMHYRDMILCSSTCDCDYWDVSPVPDPDKPLPKSKSWKSDEVITAEKTIAFRNAIQAITGAAMKVGLLSRNNMAEVLREEIKRILD